MRNLIELFPHFSIKNFFFEIFAAHEKVLKQMKDQLQ